jgi:hypothetical protein
MSSATNPDAKHSNVLWRMRREGNDAACIAQGTLAGFQVQLWINGRLLVAYSLSTPAQVVTWASERFADLRSYGWTPEGFPLQAEQPTPRRRWTDTRPVLVNSAVVPMRPSLA